MKDETIVLIIAILALTWLETVNILVLHINGTLLSSVAALIAGLVGYKTGKKRARGA